MTSAYIIEHPTLITMNQARDILFDTSIAIKNERIAALGTVKELKSAFPQAECIDGRGKLVLPGLINCHTHIAMSLQKGITLAIPNGLYRVMWPVEKNLTEDDVYFGALAGGAEALLGGSTTVVDHYFHAEQIARAVTQIGLRAVIGHTIMSRLGPITGENEMEKGVAFIREWKNKSQLVTPWLAPHASDTVATEWLQRLRHVASDEGVGLHLHLAQSSVERDFIAEQKKLGCVEYLAEIGFLGSDVIAAHCIFITDQEMELLSQFGVHPVYCPMGHSLSGHPAQAWRMVQKGADVLIGTDCVTGNNVMDLIGELRLAGAAQKQMTGDPSAMPAIKILEMVTVNAAAAIGMQNELGVLAPGYLADVVMLDFDGLSVSPAYSIIDNVVYCCNGRDVHSVFVNGKKVVENHRLLTADEKALAREVETRGSDLMRRAVRGDAELEALFASNPRYSLG